MFEIFWRNWLIIRVAHSFSRLAALFHDELSGDSSGPASPRGLVSCQAIIVSCILALMSNISPHPLRSSYPYICTSIFFDNFTVCVWVCVCMSSSNWDEHSASRVRHNSSSCPRFLFPFPFQLLRIYDIWLPLVRKYLLSKHNLPRLAAQRPVHARVAIFLCPSRFSICMCECVRMFR